MSTPALPDVPVGTRVTVRRRLPDGRASDVVGPVTAHEPGAVTVAGREGEVRVDLADVVAHRVVRPVPWRVTTFLGRGEVAVLDPAGADGPTLTALTDVVVDLVATGTPVVLLADDRDLVARLIGAATTDPPKVLVLDPPRPGSDPAAWATLDRTLAERLGRAVDAGQLRVTAVDPSALAAAREAGWQARLLTPPG